MKMKDFMSVKLKTIKEKINIKQEFMYKVGRRILFLMICVVFTYVVNICVFTVDVSVVLYYHAHTLLFKLIEQNQESCIKCQAQYLYNN